MEAAHGSLAGQPLAQHRASTHIHPLQPVSPGQASVQGDLAAAQGATAVEVNGQFRGRHLTGSALKPHLAASPQRRARIHHETLTHVRVAVVEFCSEEDRNRCTANMTPRR